MYKLKKGHNHSKVYEYCYNCVACTSGELYLYDDAGENKKFNPLNNVAPLKGNYK